ncbi:MAG: TonB-dependent receptor [Acidobacteria bacterium]|nr:TonB-dependent receptor [Acidobacteriota bacterium]
MRKSSLLFTFSSVLCFVSLVFPQGEGGVHGSVVAKEDGSPLANVKVRLEGSSLAEVLDANTGEDGHFGFQHLLPGDYSLVAEHEEFMEERVRFTLKPREEQNITLSLSLRPLNVVVEVTAESVSLPSVHSPSSTVLDERQLNSFPLAQRNNIPDVVIAAAPGMIRGHDDFVHVRGSELALNTFINGVSFWENPHSVFSGGFSPDAIQSANVMTGGFSAEYGNRFGGVLDVVTRSGFSMDNEGSLSFGIGTALRHNLAAEYGGHVGKIAYYLSSSGFESARFLSPPDPRSIHNTGRGSHNFFQLDVNANANNFLKLVLMGDGSNFQIPKAALDDEVRPNANASQRTRAQTSIFTWSHVFSKETLLNTSFYQRWSRSLLLPAVDPLSATAFSERTLLTTGVKSDLTRLLGHHTFKGGIDLVLLRPEEQLFYDVEGYRRLTHQLHLPHVHLTEPIQFTGRVTGGQISLYLQDAVQLTSHLTVDAGLRYDQYSLAVSDFHFSPRFNVAYRFSEKGAMLHGSYNHFFAPPPIENVMVGSAGLTRFIREIGRSLGPVQSVVENQFELGLTHPLHPQVLVGLTGYYRTGNHPVHTVLFPDSRIYAYANFDRERAYGVEAKMDVPELNKLGLSGYLNYALGRVYFYNPVTAGFIPEVHHAVDIGRFLAPMDQTHTLNAGFTYRHQRSGLWTSLVLEYGSGTPTEMEEHEGTEVTAAVPERVSPHFTQNFSIGVDLLRKSEKSRFSLQFNVENLTDNVYKVAQENIFSPGQFYTPRVFSGSLKVRF